MTSFLPRGSSRLKPAVAIAIGIVLVVIAYEIPQLYGPAITYKFGSFLILAIAVLGLNLLTGYTGQISIGHSAFFGVGAYGTAILTANAHWPLLPALVVSVLVTFVVGVIAGFPALRIKGIYLGLVTLALAVLFPALLNRYPELTGGTAGKQGVPSLHAPSWSGLADDQWICYVLIVATAVVYLLTKLAVRGRVGRALRTIREDELSASVYGVNLAKYKVLVFGVSAAITGFAGGLFTLQGNLLASGSVDFTLVGSIDFLAAVVIGGAGTIVGSLIGAGVTFYLPDQLQSFDPALAPLVYGLLLVVIILVMPTGIMGLLRKLAGLLGRFRGGGGGPPHARDATEPAESTDSTEVSSSSSRPRPNASGGKEIPSVAVNPPERLHLNETNDPTR